MAKLNFEDDQHQMTRTILLGQSELMNDNHSNSGASMGIRRPGKPTVEAIARRHARVAAAGMEIYRPRAPDAHRP